MRAIVRISGGIGNQFFQLAFADYISRQRQVSVQYDISFYLSGPTEATTRRFLADELQPGGRYANLNISTIEESFKTSSPFSSSRFLDSIQRFIIRVRFIRSLQVIHFNLPRRWVWALIPDRFVHIFIGNWQDLRFVDNSFKHNVMQNLERNLTQIKLDRFRNFIGVHVRRGDYLSRNSVHHLLELEYYLNGIDYLRRISPSSQILVFSDDTDWCRENLKSDAEYVFASDYLTDEVSELFVMSNLKFLVIANSSFSLTAAVLGYQEKYIVAPRKWYLRTSHSPVSCAPPNWMLL
jgi:hypothetical protein